LGEKDDFGPGYSPGDIPLTQLQHVAVENPQYDVAVPPTVLYAAGEIDTGRHFEEPQYFSQPPPIQEAQYYT